MMSLSNSDGAVYREAANLIGPPEWLIKFLTFR
jgi:hypothetical protein